jgi:hypothetical protein
MIWHHTFIKGDEHDIEWEVELSPFLNYGKHCSIGFASQHLLTLVKLAIPREI